MVENPAKSRITKSCKNLNKQDKTDLEKQTMSGLAKSITIKSTLWERFAWVKQRAKTYKMKEGFLRVRRQLLNNVNTGINFSTAHMAIWIPLHNQSSSTHCNSNSNVCFK